MRPVLRGGHVDAATVQKAVARIAEIGGASALVSFLFLFVCLFIVMQVRYVEYWLWGSVCVYVRVRVRVRTRHADKLLEVDRWVDNE